MLFFSLFQSVPLDNPYICVTTKVITNEITSSLRIPFVHVNISVVATLFLSGFSREHLYPENALCLVILPTVSQLSKVANNKFRKWVRERKSGERGEREGRDCHRVEAATWYSGFFSRHADWMRNPPQSHIFKARYEFNARVFCALA